MWEELTGLISWWDLPWCVGGDFNIIRFPSEWLRAASFSRAMYGFSDFIALHGLMDIPMAKGLYTWSNSSSASCLDRFLFSRYWLITSLSFLNLGCLEFFLTIFLFY